MSHSAQFLDAAKKRLAEHGLERMLLTIQVTFSDHLASYAQWDPDADTLLLATRAPAGEIPVAAILRELAERHYLKLDSRRRYDWDQKMVAPAQSTFQRLQDLLNDGVSPGQLHEQFSDAVSRLTAIHVANALITYGGMAAQVPIDQHPGTSDFVCGRRKMSLLPLTCYVARDDLRFASAFTRFLWNEGKVPATEESVGRYLTDLLLTCLD